MLLLIYVIIVSALIQERRLSDAMPVEMKYRSLNSLPLIEAYFEVEV